MKMHHRTIEILEARIAPAIFTTLTWQGDLATNGWDDGTLNTNTNWLSNLGAHKIPVDGNVLSFPASPVGGKTNVNDITGLDLRSLSFTGVGYNITGQAITLSTGLTANIAGAGLNEFHPKVTLTADQTFSSSATTTAVFRFDDFDLAGKTLTVDGGFTLRFGTLSGTKLTGAGAIIKNGTGTLQIGDSNDFTGPVQVNAGVLSVANDGLGAAGAGNGTTVASGASAGLSANTTAEDFTISGNGTAGQAGAIFVGLANNTLTGAIRLGADATIAQAPTSGGSLTLTGALGAADDALAILTIRMGSEANNLALAATSALTTELAGTTPGATGHDQLKVVGKINLAGATLSVVPSFAPQVGDTFTIVENDGIEDIVGTFAGLAQGAAFTTGGVNFTIIYNGGDGNDVVLTVASLVNPPVPVTLSNGGKTATFTDVDGDLVTVKTTKGAFQQTDFTAIATGVAGGGQLQQINLTTHAADFAGAGLTITAKPGPLGGNGFVNVGYVNATGIDLGVVKIGGDLGRINAGTVGADAKVPAIKSLTVESLGLLGTNTQASGGTLESKIDGAVPKLAVKGDVRASVKLSGADGVLGTATVGGTITDGSGSTGSLSISAAGGITSLSIGGDIRTAENNVSINSGTTIGKITVGGAISGSSTHTVTISAFGLANAPAVLDLALKSLTVKGSVEFSSIFAGAGTFAPNPDASIGSVSVGGDWIASSLTAGTSFGPDGTSDGKVGNNDDIKLAGPFGVVARDNPAIFSSIGSFTVKGQALGTAAPGDMFGIVAERIGKAKVGGRTFAFTNGATPEAFFAAPTGPGAGTENPAFDFTIRELGSLTPTVALGGSQLDISSDGKTATFTDVDGDKVTVKRSAGTFVPGDFIITDNAAGGGQLRTLTFTAAPNDAIFNAAITAAPGPGGGNGLVNIGFIVSAPLGKLSVAGDVGSLSINASGPAPSVKDFSARALGLLGTSTGATFNAVFFGSAAPKLTVAGDVRGTLVQTTGDLGQFIIGGSLVGVGTTTAILSDQSIGTVKIGGGIRVNANALSPNIVAVGGRIGVLTVGGDIAGGINPVGIGAKGQVTEPLRGLDVAIGQFTVKGGVEGLNVFVGSAANADASIGAISVGRAWIASTVAAGVVAGTDNFFGTADDAKLTGAGVRDEARFSTIASIVIKGQALGSAAAGDSFGIVAEQVLKAKIGTRVFKFDKGERDAADAFSVAPTGPGATALVSDFFLREIIN